MIVMMEKSMKEKLQKKAKDSGIGQMSAYVRQLIMRDLEK